MNIITNYLSRQCPVIGAAALAALSVGAAGALLYSNTIQRANTDKDALDRNMDVERQENLRVSVLGLSVSYTQRARYCGKLDVMNPRITRNA